MSQYLFVQRSAPDYANEPLDNIQTTWNLTLGIPILLLIMSVGSNTRTYVNKIHTTAVSHMSKEALKACLLPKETCCFISEYDKTKTESNKEIFH
ncbi:hypothetical protein RO3G_09076 [Rhizopus delemar RA 99-880]|uniref:Uncharacterized protein n=1 Tax=Rhizopus delemar (strain RA 99-880 / ATCC MYA-4621 / FGSC 9543 / NRRL 43880) TaxID=246409 RepID=I1C7D6_RHIO9|nr:hypothetical protein RO3G_09076 [Rhizopus delemar RA 99-880]|eukprot:EIE84366.1 hypothetical protein RO3G_09076 [Rhizopus delemar RA 99-880]